MKHAILLVSPIFLINACKSGIHNIEVIDNKIPEDAEYIRAFTNDNTGRGMIGLVLESESFEDIENGKLLPILPEPLFNKVSR